MVGHLLVVGAACLGAVKLFNRVMEEELIPRRKMKKNKNNLVNIDWKFTFTTEEMEELGGIAAKTSLADLLGKGARLRRKIDEGTALTGEV